MRYLQQLTSVFNSAAAPNFFKIDIVFYVFKPTSSVGKYMDHGSVLK